MAVHVNYDAIASNYDARYTLGLYDGVREVLRTLVLAKKPARVLEVGCGTGYWLSALLDLTANLYGLDYSLAMLKKAGERDSRGRVVRGRAETLPFQDATFDFMFCVNALHHFERFDSFIAE